MKDASLENQLATWIQIGYSSLSSVTLEHLLQIDKTVAKIILFYLCTIIFSVMFCFYFKHKTAAILMAAFNLSIGIFGTITFGIRLQCRVRCLQLPDDISEDYLIFSIFHLITSLPLMAGLIWEKPVLILIYELFHISTLAALLTHSVIFLPIGRVFYVLCMLSSFIIYCMYCVYLFYLQMKLKRRSRLGTVYYIEAVYFCNSNIQ